MDFNQILTFDKSKKILGVLLVMILGTSLFGNSLAFAYFPHAADYDNSVVNWNKFTKLVIQNDMLFFFGHTYSPTKSKYIYTVTQVAVYNALVDAKNNHPLVSEDSIVSGAASEILSTLLPNHENRITLFYNKQISKIDNYNHEEIMKGVMIGKESARKFLIEAQRDDPNLPFTDSIPEGPCKWTGTNPATPDAGQWQTFFITNIDDYLASPPHDCNSPEDLAQVQEVFDVSITRTALDSDKGRYYGEDVGFLLNDVIAPIVIAENSDVFDTTFTYAHVNAGMYDSGVAIWNSKYTYWTERPEKRISNLDQIIQSPNFPAYPSGHAGIAATAAVILSEIYPEYEEYLMNLSDEISKSRLDVGVHYRQDNEEGEKIGKIIGEMIIEKMNNIPVHITYVNIS